MQFGRWSHLCTIVIFVSQYYGLAHTQSFGREPTDHINNANSIEEYQGFVAGSGAVTAPVSFFAALIFPSNPPPAGSAPSGTGIATWMGYQYSDENRTKLSFLD